MLFFCTPLAACLRHIRLLKPWDLLSVLVQKYDWPLEQARLFASFLEPMLAYEPSQRATAAECLNHPWITGAPASALEGRFFRHPFHQVPPTDTQLLLERPLPFQPAEANSADGHLEAGLLSEPPLHHDAPSSGAPATDPYMMHYQVRNVAV